MGKESDSICHTCNAVDYIDHFFYDYVKINQLWILARDVISRNLSKNLLRLTVEDVMLNYQNTNYNLNELKCHKSCNSCWEIMYWEI